DPLHITSRWVSSRWKNRVTSRWKSTAASIKFSLKSALIVGATLVLFTWLVFIKGLELSVPVFGAWLSF
ncbi:hypothetical protein QCN27_20225, partial [Cereibacter sp. SYSU M97828]|nr:hypothetical protein [Cereibacter flavus]